MRFSDITAETPTREGLAAGYASLHALLDSGERDRALAGWDGERRRFETWSSLVGLRFAQDTADPAARAARDFADALQPEATALEVAMKRRLLADPDRAGLERAAGGHVVRLWEVDVLTFEPAIAPALEEEAGLRARYTELLASAQLDVEGERVNLSGLGPFLESPDRCVRHRAERARWGFFAAHSAELDSLFDRLVRLRHGMARTLGLDSYTTLAYRRLRRLDYGPAEVARYRDAVVADVVPLVGRLLEQRRRRHGWDELFFWDEHLLDPAGNPRPLGGHDALLDGAQAMFDRLHPRLGSFFRMMRDGGFLDLRNRPGKAGGGFCTSFPDQGMPFVFASFDGTQADINVLTHEMGHAFQNRESRHQASIDTLWPTMEAAEINSMGLEFLCHPQIGLLVGEAQAERFRRMHLVSSLAFLPYGACVDHFQHEVYARPEASPAERHAIWQRLEQRYLPWARYGDLAHCAKGGRWQAKPHIYGSPFYYIDYTLALCCALQLWARARTNPQDSLERYVSLCARGGEAPFGTLVRDAGLRSPFAPGALEEVVREAKAALG